VGSGAYGHEPKVRTGETSPLPWTLRVVSDAPITWLLFFGSPPKNNDVYGEMKLFTFRPEEGWQMYDSHLLTNNWEAAIGQRPVKTFSNPHGSANRSQPIGPGAGRTPQLAGSGG
jgi:hypothetical protein